ncbi:MAG: DNA internalization-related competence protein ComEC/Rec2 [Acidiferrobacterales bacterium]
MPVLPDPLFGIVLIPLLYWARSNTIALLASFVLAGLFWSVLHANLVLEQQLPWQLEGKDLEVVGNIVGLPHKDQRRTKFRLQVSEAKLDGDVLAWQGLVQLNNYNSGYDLRAGETWKLTIRLKRPHGFQNPGGFDYEAWMFRERITGTGYVRKYPAPARLAESSTSLGAVRETVGNQIQTILDQKKSSGIITALVNGDRSGLTPAHWQVMRQTGTSHLMAISGLHIGLIAGLVFFLVRWLWAMPGTTVLWLPAQRMAALASMFAAGVYAALAGFSIPTQRALIMLLVVMLMVWFKHRIQTNQVLLGALLVILVLDPLAVMAPGFWLSFFAVGLIAYVLQGRQKQPRWQQFITIQIAITIGLTPLLLVFFQQASIISPITNAIAIPFFSFLVVPVSLLGVALLNAGLESSGVLLITFAEHAVSWFWPGLVYSANLIPASWATLAPPGWTWLLAMAGVLLLLAPPAWPARWLGLILWLPLLTVTPEKPAQGKVWLTQLDVGQGLATIIQTRRHTMIYDTGPKYSERFDTGQAVVIPFLQKQGIQRVNKLMISHGDNDHIGGANSILKTIKIDEITSGEPGKPVGATLCLAGQSWNWDGVSFQVLHPREGGDYTGDNNGACVLKIIEKNGSILLTGDIEIEAEELLLQSQGNLLKSDVITVPHHGSKTSSHDEFLDKVSPKLAIISAGYRNRYRHPSQKVVKRYQEKGVKLLNTAKSGAITVSFDKNGPVVSRYRQKYGRFWFSQTASSKARRLIH